MLSETTANLMQDQLLEQIFSSEECALVAQADTDSQLTAAWQQEQAAALPHFARQARFRQQLLSQGPANHWISERLLACLQQVNREYYRFDVDALAGTQLLTLTTGDYWNWHLDLGLQRFSLRKLTLVVFLDPPEAAEGGHFAMVMNEHPPAELQAGHGLLFPAYCMSRISPVLSGTRRFLISWGCGREAFA